MDPLSLRHAVRTALLQRAGLRPDSQGIADAMAATCRVLEAQLAPVIGTRGLETLFSRVIHQSLNDVSFLTKSAAESSGATAGTLTQFAAHLAAQPMAAAIDGGVEFLAGLAELLATFIGAPLTNRLLAPLWDYSSESAIGRSHED